ncbi:MAG: ABC transporter ATP-binding protein [Acidimicrobiales bacterium]|nr:ABC transporter ATP-binding protein [Acidimicrobiales bacterium]
MSLRRLLVRNLAPYRKILGLVVVLQTIQTFASLTLPSLNSDLINNGVLTGDNGYIRRTGVVMMGFTALQIVFAVVAIFFGARVAMRFGRDLRRDLFGRVNAFSTREVGTFGAPSLITRITNDVQQVQMLVVLTTTLMITAPLTMVIGIVLATREDVGLSWVLVVSMPAVAVVLGSIVSRMVPAFDLMQVRIDRVNGVLREQITGVRVVRAFVREPEEAERFAGANADLTATSLRAGRLMAAMFPTIMFTINAASVGVLWIGADRVGAGETQIGSVVAYLSYLVQILMAVAMSTFVLSQVPRASVAAGRIMEVLETDTTVTPPSDPVTALRERATLEFRDVGFHYAGAARPVLHDLGFRVGPGETTGIIGSTGAGKTTLMNLIPRLFDATSGSVLVGGVDVRELDPGLLARTVAYAPQRPYLFSGTVASNLRFGRPDATDEELWAALEVAQAADFVQAMPDGIDSSISQGGTNVSGGQRQRLTIARALVVDPQIYVFDDSFSALDVATAARLNAALRPHTADAAVVVVAQRVSTIVDADQILVLEDGALVGRGTHDELVADCPTYAEIVESQLGEGAAA